jgi:hypothetical protein
MSDLLSAATRRRRQRAREQSLAERVAPPVAKPAPTKPVPAAPVVLTSVEEREGRGRCVLASVALAAGTSLDAFSGRPYAACLLPFAHGRYCERCFEELSSGAAGARFCSDQCTSAMDAAHGNEAAWPVKDRPPSHLLLAVRCLWRRHRYTTQRGGGASDCGGDEPQGSGGRSGASRSSFQQTGSSDSDGDAHEHALFDAMATEAPPADDDLELGALAASVPDGFLPPGATARHVGSMLARLRANAFSFADTSGMVIGVGCYPSAAILNHSCVPNCVLTSGGGGVLRVRTAVAVAAGAELTHSYIDLCQPTHARRHTLRTKYGFECTCTRCERGATYIFSGESVDKLMEARRTAHPIFGDLSTCGGGSACDAGVNSSTCAGSVCGGAVRGGGGGPASAIAAAATAAEVGCSSAAGGGAATATDGEEEDEAGAAIAQSSSLLLAAQRVGVDGEEGAALVEKALLLRRQHCHRLSTLRYEAESAMERVALEAGGASEVAVDCGRNALNFLEMCLAHVAWHPSLALARLHLAMSVMANGDAAGARKLLAATSASLAITHGHEHPLARQAAALAAKIRSKETLKGGSSERKPTSTTDAEVVDVSQNE